MVGFQAGHVFHIAIRGSHGDLLLMAAGSPVCVCKQLVVSGGKLPRECDHYFAGSTCKQCTQVVT